MCIFTSVKAIKIGDIESTTFEFYDVDLDPEIPDKFYTL